MTSAERSRRYRQRQAARLEQLQRLAAQGDTMEDLGPPDTYRTATAYRSDIVKKTGLVSLAMASFGAAFALLLVAVARNDLAFAVTSGALALTIGVCAIVTVNALWNTALRR